MIVSAQIRAARGLLGISQSELANLADIGVATIKRVELATEISGSARTIWKLQTALEKAGVIFIPADQAGGPGVRLREAPSSKAKRRRSR